MTRRHIGLVLFNLPLDHPSGSVSYVKGLATHLVECGFNVTVFCNYYESNENESYKVCIIKTDRLFSWKNTISNANVLWNHIKIYIQKMSKYLGDIDLLIFQHQVGSNILASIIQYLFNIPSLSVIHGTDWYELNEQEKKQYIITGLNTYKALICPSITMKKMVSTYCNKNEKIILSEPGVNPIFMEANKRKGNGKYILFVGRLVKEKGIIYLIEAFLNTKLFETDSIQLFIIGSGNLEKYIKEKYILQLEKGMIVLLGALSQGEICKFMEEALCLIFPSVWDEPFGLVLLESMAIGLPIIANNVGVVQKVLGKDYPFIMNNIRDLEEQIHKYLYYPDKKILSQKLRNRSQLFSRKNTSKPLLNYIQNVFSL